MDMTFDVAMENFQFVAISQFSQYKIYFCQVNAWSTIETKVYSSNGLIIGILGWVLRFTSYLVLYLG